MLRDQKYWKVRGGAVSLETPVIVGILNVTPDSFSDGGAYSSAEHAAGRAREMFEQGAEIVDVGGESTRPGAAAVSAAEQIRRVVPVIEQIDGGLISIDTTKTEVAAAAIAAGASIINDVSACQDDSEMFELAAKTGAGLVLMHRLVSPVHDQYSDEYVSKPKYEDVVRDVLDWLLHRAAVAQGYGVDRRSIAIDPGLGFGKSVEQNMALVRGIEAFVETGFPVFIGASRKSFVGAMHGIEDPKDRDVASATMAAEICEVGAQIFRVHDVRTHCRVLQSTSSRNGQ